MSETINKVFEDAVKAKEIPGAVMIATDRSGTFKYEKVFGTKALEGPEASEPLTRDAIMWMASCTKLMTCIAFMQCIERGLIGLDDDVAKVLPEVADLEILTGFDDQGKPKLAPRNKTMTYRHLITHSSGISYDIFDPPLMRWRATRGEQPGPGHTIVSRYLCPLVFEPGESWTYSASIDWLGKAVERVNGDLRLEHFLQKNVWGPLGIDSLCFRPLERPDLMKRKMGMTERDPATPAIVVPKVDDPQRMEIQDDLGGGGMWGNMPEYLKVMQAILKDDGTLLKSETIDQIFQPQLSEASRTAVEKLLLDPLLNDMFGGIPPHLGISWGLAGMLNLSELPGRRAKESLTWGGMPNLTWWVDRKNGVCGIFGTQVLPPGDRRCVELTQIFEKDVYEKFASRGSKI
ncbi:hypothetical protein MMC25_006751 [Agyrium rufum]|nr:hypothetical protein [Agyrium rufum]